MWSKFAKFYGKKAGPRCTPHGHGKQSAGAGVTQCQDSNVQIDKIEFLPRAGKPGMPAGEDIKVKYELDMVYSDSDSAALAAKDLLQSLTSGEAARTMKTASAEYGDAPGDTASFLNQKGMRDIQGEGVHNARKYKSTDEVYGILCGETPLDGSDKPCVTWAMEGATAAAGSGTTGG